MEGPPEQLWSKVGDMHTSPSGHKESPSSGFVRHSERPAQARLSVAPSPCFLLAGVVPFLLEHRCCGRS